MNATTEYSIWSNMKNRCLNPRATRYSSYGGRGITICDRWVRSFEAFFADVGPRPAGLTLDRIDNDGNYEPGNVRWASARQQSGNRGMCRYFEWEGETLNVSEISRRVGVKDSTILWRLDRGQSITDATRPVG